MFDWRSLRTLKLIWDTQLHIGDIIRITHSARALEEVCIIASTPLLCSFSSQIHSPPIALESQFQSVEGRGPNELFKLSNLRVFHFNINVGVDDYGDMDGFEELTTESSMPFSHLTIIKIDVCSSPDDLKMVNYSAYPGWSQLEGAFPLMRSKEAVHMVQKDRKLFFAVEFLHRY